MGNELLDVFKLVLPEQVTDVPQISQDSIQQRLVDRDLGHTQPAEQLVEVPTIFYFLAQRCDGHFGSSHFGSSVAHRQRKTLL